MSETAAISPSPGLRATALQVLREDAAAWLFVLRTVLALFITGWLAMRFALPQPSTAMLTVVIVMNRQTGLVLAKSFYRAIGTFAGAAVALLMMSLFPQERVLLLLALALWVGLCAGGALLYRNFTSYGFVLAGYTASIVALPSIDAPLGAFDVAVARISEVLLGILVAGVISDTVFPSRMRDALRRAAYDQFNHVMEFVRGSTGGAIAREAMEQAHLRFVREALALEDLRSSVIFEDVDARARSGRLQLFNQRFMATSTSFQSLHHLINRLLRSGRERTARALILLYHPIAEALQLPAEAGRAASALLPPLAAARQRIGESAAPTRAALSEEQHMDFDTGVALLLRFTDELIAYVEIAATLQAPRLVAGSVEKARFERSNDFLGAALAALHTTVTMLALGAFWIYSAWPSGSSAMLIAAIFCGLFAAAPNPVRQAGQSMIGWAFGIAAGFVVEFFALSQVDGYALLIAVTLPLFLLAPYLLTRPTLISYGVGYGMGFIYNLALTNAMHYDPVRFLNDASAQLVGLGCAVLAFAVAPPVAGTRWFQRRQIARLRSQVALAAEAPLAGLAYRFESVNRDLLQQIVARTPPGSDASRALLAWALAVHETGRALIELRQAHAAQRLQPPGDATVSDAIGRLARFYEHPDTKAYVAARDAIAAAIAAAQECLPAQPTAGAILTQLHLLRMALLDGESVIAEYMPRAIAASSPSENDHAA
jgi:uncharacterized membrane protein YccC